MRKIVQALIETVRIWCRHGYNPRIRSWRGHLYFDAPGDRVAAKLLISLSTADTIIDDLSSLSAGKPWPRP